MAISAMVPMPRIPARRDYSVFTGETPVPRQNPSAGPTRRGTLGAMGTDEKLTAAVKALAGPCGFDLVGIAPPGPPAAGEALNDWLGRRWHAGMAYMAANVAKRLWPGLLVAGARSVICLAVSYAPAGEAAPETPGVARYARGRDYHKVLKSRCRKLMDRIRQIAPGFVGRALVDTGPVMERALARRAGLGVIGLNGCLITARFGSYVLLGEIICNLPLAPDTPIEGDCGRCGSCLEACPTGALGDRALVDARKCASYLTIEHRGQIGEALWPRMGRWVFGCDLCQSVCPHNRDLPPGDRELRSHGQLLGGASLEEILAWRADDWDRATRGSATRRATYPMFLRNAIIAAGNGAAGQHADGGALREALEALGRRKRGLGPICQWALGQLGASATDERPKPPGAVDPNH